MALIKIVHIHAEVQRRVARCGLLLEEKRLISITITLVQSSDTCKARCGLLLEEKRLIS
jgi:hypothetical protein